MKLDDLIEVGLLSVESVDFRVRYRSLTVEQSETFRSKYILAVMKLGRLAVEEALGFDAPRREAMEQALRASIFTGDFRLRSALLEVSYQLGLFDRDEDDSDEDDSDEDEVGVGLAAVSTVSAPKKTLPPVPNFVFLKREIEMTDFSRRQVPSGTATQSTKPAGV